jgi:rifampin ADP-ribosylating transferase
MGADGAGSTGDPVERLQRWERSGGIWRVMGRSPDGEIMLELETCSGEPMDTFTSGDRGLAEYIGEREMSDGSLDAGPFFHGTKAELHPGDLLRPGRESNFGDRDVANFVYMTATMDAAIWGAELAVGEGEGRIYRVEPTGPFEHDPNLTDTRFRGNRTRSYRSREPLRIIEEITDWAGHPPEVLQQMRESVAAMNAQGIKAINE